MRSPSLLLLSEDPGTAAHLRSVLSVCAPAAALDVCTTPVQLRHRLRADPACHTVAIDEVAIGNALTPFVRHLRTERHGLNIVLLTALDNDESTARGALAGVDLVSPRDEQGTAALSTLLTGRHEREDVSTPAPLHVLAWGASRPMLATLGKSQRLRTTSVSTEQALDPQLAQLADAILVVATPAEEAAVVLFRLRARGLPLIVVCDEQSRDGFARLGATECLTPGSSPEQIELVVTRLVEQGRLRAETTLLRNKEQRLRSLVESLPEGVVLTDPDGIVQAINHAAVGLCRIDNAQAALGRPLSGLFGADNEAATNQLIAEVVTGRRIDTSIVIDGEEPQRRFQLRAVPFARDASQPPFVLLTLGVGPVTPSPTASEEVATAAETAAEDGEEVEVTFSDDAASSEEPALAEERSRLRDELSSTLARLTVAEALSATLKDERETFSRRLSELEHECDRLRQETEDARSLLAERAPQQDAALAAEHALVQERDALRRQLDDAEHERMALQRGLTAAQWQATELAAAQEARDASLEAQRLSVEGLERTRDELQAQCAVAEGRVAALSQAEETLRAESEALRQRLAALEEENDARHRQQNDAAHEQQGLQDALATAQRRVSELEAARDAVAAERDAHGQAVAALERSRDEVQAQYSASEERVATLTRVEQTLRADADALRQQLTAVEQERDEQRGQLEHAAHEQQALQEALAAAHRQISELEAAREAHAIERESHGHVVAALERTRDELQAQSAASEERVTALARAEEALRADADALRQQLVTHEQERDAQNHAIAFLGRTCDELRAQHAAYDERVTSLTHTSDALRGEGDRLRQRLAQLEDQRSAVDDELRALREQVSSVSELQQAYDAERANRSGLIAELEVGRRALDDARREAEVAHVAAQASEEERWAALALAEARAQALEIASCQVESLRAQQTRASQEVEARRAGEAEAAEARTRLSAEVARLSEQLHSAVQELEPLRKAHAAACAGYLTGKRAQVTLEQEMTVLRAQLEESRVMTANAMADAERARLSRDDWERRAETALARQAAENALMQQRADALLRSEPTGSLDWLLGVAAIGVMTTTPDGRLEHANDAAAHVCGWPNAESAMAHGRMPEALLALSPRGVQSIRFETWVEGHDTTLRWVVGIVTTVRSVANERQRVEWALVDLSQQHADKGSASAPRVETMTHLVSAAASECTTMLEQVEQMMRRDTLGRLEVPAEHLVATRRGLRRTRLVLDQIAAPARAGTSRLEVIDLADALLQAAALVTRLVGNDIACQISPPLSGLFVAADRGDIQQLLSAVALSGRECLPLGGLLTITGSAVTAETSHDGESVSRPSVVIHVSASGSGAQSVVWQQATDLAARLGGWVEIRHEAQSGSTIDVVLPRAIRLNEAHSRRAHEAHQDTIDVERARPVDTRQSSAMAPAFSRLR